MYNNRRNDPRYSLPEAPKPGSFYRKVICACGKPIDYEPGYPLVIMCPTCITRLFGPKEIKS